MTENKAHCAPVAMATEIFKYNFYLPLTLHIETLEGNIQALSQQLAFRKKLDRPRHCTGHPHHIESTCLEPVTKRLRTTREGTQERPGNCLLSSKIIAVQDSCSPQEPRVLIGNGPEVRENFVQSLCP